MPNSTQKYNSKKSSPIKSFFSYFKKMMGYEPSLSEKKDFVRKHSKTFDILSKSDYISRDLSWLKFDERVLAQAQSRKRNVFERMKFLAITSSNLDEFFSIRVGSLYNYLDFGRERTDYSGLKEGPFFKTLMAEADQLTYQLDECYRYTILPDLKDEHVQLAEYEQLNSSEKKDASEYFNKMVYPMLTPMLFDQTHTFPSLLAKTLIFAVVTKVENQSEGEDKRLSFVQIPQNLPRFYSFERADKLVFLPIEAIIRSEIGKLYKNIEIFSVGLFRIIRNGDFDLIEHEDADTDFLDEIKQKIKDRRLGRVTKLEVEENFDLFGLELMLDRWALPKEAVFEITTLIDFTSLFQIIGHRDIKSRIPQPKPSIFPAGIEAAAFDNIFETMKKGDILLHHPFNNFEPVIQLLEQASEDKSVLAIKITLYRISKNSRIANALLKAAENGKHVSVLFEIKARFDEERNIKEAQRLQKAGCFVIFGIQNLKTHTKMLQVIRNEGSSVVGYAHLSSGNYNEETSKLYTDVSLLTTNEVYTRDISEFFNVITGHSNPNSYENLITAPNEMRIKLLEMIAQEGTNAENDLPAGICIKLNSLQDKAIIDALYAASQKGVPIRLIVRGICCLKPGRPGLSENISVKSIVGDFLEHSRIYYFHNSGNPLIYGGSADVMVRSFDKRIESLFKFTDQKVINQVIYILKMNLLDNVNSFIMHENGEYIALEGAAGEVVNVHEHFYNPACQNIEKIQLF